MGTPFPPIFDGHNDVLLKQFTKGPNAYNGFRDGYDAHIDLPKAKIGGFGGGFFAIYVDSGVAFDGILDQMNNDTYDIPLPPMIPQKDALQTVMSQAAILSQMDRDGFLKICTTVPEIRHCLDNGLMAAIMHIEGAEGIDTNLDVLDVLFRAGLRSIGPVWSRPTAFGHGVPFRFPSDGDTGPGLTSAGKDLVRECNKMGIMLDMSHLTSAGFWDTVKLSDAPIVATHSNSSTLCRHSRNLTDDQLSAIKDSDGMVGINFAVDFLRLEGQTRMDVGIDQMMRHLDYLIEHVGEDRVGFGSDFDGAQIPPEIGDVGGLPVLQMAMKKHGVDDILMAKICNGNWLRVLEKTWK